MKSTLFIMKKFIIIVLFTTIFVLLINYIGNCVKEGKILLYMELTLKHLGVITTFVGMIYLFIKYSNKGEIISYFLPVIVWYLAYTTILNLDVFSYVIVKIPSTLFILLMVSIAMVLLGLYKHIFKIKY